MQKTAHACPQDNWCHFKLIQTLTAMPTIFIGPGIPVYELLVGEGVTYIRYRNNVDFLRLVDG